MKTLDIRNKMWLFIHIRKKYRKQKKSETKFNQKGMNRQISEKLLKFLALIFSS